MSTGEFASRRIRVSGDDVENLVLKTGTGFEVSGRVTVEGGSIRAMRGVRVTAMAVEGASPMSGMLLTGSAVVGGDGVFRMTNLLGAKVIRVTGLPDGWALERVTASGADVTDSGIDVVANTPLDIVVGRQTEVLGRVVDDTGANVPGVSVFIFSEDPQQWMLPHSRYVAAASAERDGRFRVRGLPPGRYRAAARFSLMEGRIAEIESLDVLVAGSTSFSVTDGQQVPLTVRLR